MILSYRDIGDGLRHRVEARITTDHPASSYGMPVIVVLTDADGEALDVASYMLLDYIVHTATRDELAALASILAPWAEPVLADDADIID